MLYNKDQVRITNDKKKLVKRGKNWIVASAFVLALVAGGCTLAGQANADTTRVQGQSVVTQKAPDQSTSKTSTKGSQDQNSVSSTSTSNNGANVTNSQNSHSSSQNSQQNPSSSQTFNITVSPEDILSNYVTYVSGKDGSTIQNSANVKNITYTPVTFNDVHQGEQLHINAYSAFGSRGQAIINDPDTKDQERLEDAVSWDFGYKIINPHMIGIVQSPQSEQKIKLIPDNSYVTSGSYDYDYTDLHIPPVSNKLLGYKDHFILESMPSKPVFMRLINSNNDQVNIPGTSNGQLYIGKGFVDDPYPTVNPAEELTGSHALPYYMYLPDNTKTYSGLYEPYSPHESGQTTISVPVDYHTDDAKGVDVPFYMVQLDSTGQIMPKTLKPGLFPGDYVYNNKMYQDPNYHQYVNVWIDSRHINDYDMNHKSDQILPIGASTVAPTNALNIYITPTNLQNLNEPWYDSSEYTDPQNPSNSYDNSDPNQYNPYYSSWSGKIDWLPNATTQDPSKINYNGSWSSITSGNNIGIPEYNGRVLIEYVIGASSNLSLYNVSYNVENYVYYNGQFYPYDATNISIPPYSDDNLQNPNFHFIKVVGKNSDGSNLYSNAPYPHKFYADWGSEAIVKNPVYGSSNVNEWKSDSPYFLIKFTSDSSDSNASNPPVVVPVKIVNSKKNNIFDKNNTFSIEPEVASNDQPQYNSAYDVAGDPNYRNAQVHIEKTERYYYFDFVKGVDSKGNKYYVNKYGQDIGTNPDFSNPDNYQKVYTFTNAWFSTPTSLDTESMANPDFRAVYNVPDSALGNMYIKQFELPNGYVLDSTAQSSTPYNLNLNPGQRTDIYVQGAPVHFIIELDGYPVHIDGHTADNTTTGTIEPNNQMSGHKTISAQVTLPLEIRQLDDKGNVMSTQSTSITTWTDFHTPHTYTLPDSLANYAAKNWQGYDLVSPKTVNYIIPSNSVQPPIVWDYVPEGSNDVQHSILPQITVVDRYRDANGNWHNINGAHGVPVTLQLNSDQLTSNPFTIDPDKTLINGSQTLNQTQGSQYTFDSVASDPMTLTTTNATPGYTWTDGKVPTEYYDLQEGLIDIRYVDKDNHKVVGDQIPQVGPINSSFTLDPQYYKTGTYNGVTSDPIPEGYEYANSYTAPSTYDENPQVANIYVTPIDSDIFVHGNDNDTPGQLIPGTNQYWPNGVAKSDLSRTVIRTINYVYVDPKDPAKVEPIPNVKPVKEPITFNRTAVVDKNSGQLLGYSTNGTVNIPVNDGDEAWEPSQYQTLPSVTSPTIQGYYPDQMVVPAEPITPSTSSPQTVTVKYQKAGLIDVRYINKKNNQVIKDVPLWGVIGTNQIVNQSVNGSDTFSTRELLKYLPAGYKYAGMKHADVHQFESDNQEVDVLLTKVINTSNNSSTAYIPAISTPSESSSVVRSSSSATSSNGSSSKVSSSSNSSSMSTKLLKAVHNNTRLVKSNYTNQRKVANEIKKNLRKFFVHNHGYIHGRKMSYREYLDDYKTANHSFKIPSFNISGHGFKLKGHRRPLVESHQAQKLPQTGDYQSNASVWATILVSLSAVIAGLGRAIGFKKHQE